MDDTTGRSGQAPDGPAKGAGAAKTPQVVIVGGGFGGLHVARGLAGAPVQVTVVDRRNHHLFQPLLYQVATATLSPANIAAPIRNVLREYANIEVIMAEVVGVDVERREVRLRAAPGAPNGSEEWAVGYDYLVLAAGAGDNYFGHDEWAQFAPGLKSIPEALAIRSQILGAFEQAEIETDPEKRKELLTFVLVGAGPTGVEMAGAIAEISRHALPGDFRHIRPDSARIVLLEAGPRILPMFPESLSATARAALEARGVEVKTSASVEQVDGEGVVAAAERIRARTIVWSAGVEASPAASWVGAPADKNGRVMVNGDLTIPAHAEIFAIGDTACFLHRNKPLPGLAQVAMQQGDYAAMAIRRRVSGQPPQLPFYYRDKGTMATIGRSDAVANLGFLRLGGFLAWVLWLGVHLVFLIGFRNRIQVLVEWAWAYLTYQRGARLIGTAGVPSSSPGAGHRTDQADQAARP